ncbi:MAG: RNA polymerase sigma factor [Acidimicrobiia bacterium]
MRRFARRTTGTLEERFRRGEAAAFAEVYDLHHRMVYAVARRAAGDHHAAEEIVQQAFTRAWQAAASFDPARPLGPWLATITSRTAIDAYRRRTIPVVPLDEGVGAPSAADLAEDLARVWDLRRAVDELSPAHRDLLRMVHLEGRELAEVAEQLGLPLGTVKSRLHRARAALAAALSDDAEPQGTTARLAGRPA